VRTDLDVAVGLAVVDPENGMDERVSRSVIEENVESMTSDLVLPSRSASSFA